jgi:hypothetical protein
MNHKKTTIYVALSFVIIIGFVLYLKWQETQLQDLKIAYIKGSTISDSNILDAWNDTIRRSRERNAERANNFANN